MANIVTPEQVQQVIDYAQKVISEAWEKNGPMPFAAPKVFADEGGKRYTRLIIQDDNGTGPGRFAYGFIDMTNGDLLKAASWKAPERNFPRGNVIAGKLDCCGRFRIT